MCGIAGALNLRDGLLPVDEAALSRMAGAMHHRGPDEAGLYRDARCGLAHARLSIIDLATGQQPLSNEDGTLWVSFNGEIFNYKELAAELAGRHTFKTKSDTEVIVHAFEEWGVEAFARFNGQWAIALWDSKARRLVLARDRVGVRPLHLAQHQGRLWFASEVKALFAGEPALPRGLDLKGLDETFTFWATVAPRTPFTGVEELPPGTVRVISADGSTKDTRIWAPHFHPPEHEATLSDSAAATLEALKLATSLRMLRADVPVGSYLSGGLDSSLIAALGREARGEGFHTFSVRFSDAEYDETTWQKQVAQSLGTTHHDVLVKKEDIAAAFSEVVWHAERPMLRTAPAPLYLLSRLAREHGAKVVLTGEGADEFFAGYDLFKEAQVRRFWARRPDSRWRPALLDRLYPYLARSPVRQKAVSLQFFGQGLSRWQSPGFGHGLRWQSAAALKRLFAPDVRAALAAFDAETELLGRLPPGFADWSPLAQDQALEIQTLLSGYLLSTQGDRMLMAHSVEGRFPFLDAQVMELAMRLPDRHRLAGLDEKHVLKRAAKGLVPEAILKRSKQPYRAPDALSFVDPEVPEWVQEELSPDRLRAVGVFDPAGVKKLFDKCRRQKDAEAVSNADNMALVGVLSTQLLHRRFVTDKAAVPAPAPIKTREVR
jgi:asparagine synthase (glutamine-hydrolysing)